ncbi:deazaflavin-dependent oxidoreductase (nitroreductase family) [Nocardioides daedukensis]|uniref:Deazaflavin-dependent oxidoreductase (Nitroreductase family) n=1 Tax=Nocardioides daedukensis TaxID=634462 RepID=A0A7Y9S2I6_9ACTN|nr:nitroreductase family deazaflavin-dependent oxidoreductase [Nocardioides daedukensis]NYG59312.1 deazaflavin-dependent oxidoreductase (nitroreductase family) [Nocardioides daedukensis]
MQLPRAIAIFNKYVNNHVQGLWAWLVPPWALVHHTGRSSGRALKTPVMGFKTPEGFAIPMLYGPESHWVKNLIAAGGGEIQRCGKRYQLVDPRIVPTSEITAKGIAGAYTRAGTSTLVVTLGDRV